MPVGGKGYGSFGPASVKGKKKKKGRKGKTRVQPGSSEAASISQRAMGGGY